MSRGRQAGSDAFGGLRDGFISDEVMDHLEEFGQEDIDEIEDVISASATTAENINNLKQKLQPLPIETAGAGCFNFRSRHKMARAQ